MRLGLTGLGMAGKEMEGVCKERKDRQKFGREKQEGEGNGWDVQWKARQAKTLEEKGRDGKSKEVKEGKKKSLEGK